MLSGQVNEKLEPLRMTLGLSGADFREGAFGWRGFLYYKWAMQSFWPDVMGILREIKDIQPHGPVSADAARSRSPPPSAASSSWCATTASMCTRCWTIYDESFAGLIASSAPKTFRDFLLSAPFLFLELGEKMGAISHIVSFWRYRFPQGQPALADAEELGVIFQDFASGFAERSKEAASPHPAARR